MTRDQPVRVSRVIGPLIVILVVQAVVFPIPGGVYLQGVVFGLLGALLAVGMCLIYRSNRIINFAQSSLGLVPTVIAADLIVYSQLSFAASALIGAAIAIGFGFAVYAGIIRRFARSSRLILTAASIGLAQLCLGLSLLVPRLWGEGPSPQEFGSGLDWRFALDPLVFKAEHLITIVVAPVALALVAALLLRTRVGAGVRAAADSADRASTLGIPVERMQLIVWTGATLLSFTAMFLRASIVGLPFASTDTFTTLLAALAALTIGRFTHLGRVAATAVALGVVEQAVTWNHPDLPTLYPVVLGVVIVIGLVSLGQPTTRAGRDATSSWQVVDEPRALPDRVRRRPALRLFTAVAVLALVVAAVVLPGGMSASVQLKLATVAVYAIVGISLVILMGWGGQVSLGQMGFVAVGAALGSWLTNVRGVDMSVGLLGAGGAGAAVALVLGLPALRLRGLYLAVITLAFSVICSAYLFDPRQAAWMPGGRVNRPELFGVFDLSSEHAMYELCLVVLALAFAAAVALRRGRPGRVMVAQRDNEVVAQGFGISTTRARLTAFALSGGIASVAGCLLVHVLQAFPDQLLTPDQSVSTFTATVVGGIGSPAGAVLGAVVFVGSGLLLGSAWRLLTTAIGVLLVLLVCPSGLIGAVVKARNALLRRWLAPDEDDVESAEPVPAATPRLTEVADARLRVRDLDVRIGDAPIVSDVSFDVAAGEALALLGTNGAGKSTILNAISGLLSVRAGSIELDGQAVTGLRPHVVTGWGIGQAPGGRGVFPSLSVAENLDLAGWTRPRHDPHVAVRRAEVLDLFPALATRLAEPASNLSGGEQQMLVMGMAYIAQPAVLLIDELSLGLAPLVVEQLLGVLERFRLSGTTIVVVEQSLNVAAAITDRAIFLERGRVAFDGRTADLLDQPALVRSVYLADAATPNGHHRNGDEQDGASSPARSAPPSDGQGVDMALAAHGVSVRYAGVMAVVDADIEVARDEVVGLIGANGAGKSTLLDVLTGLTPATTGRVALAGHDITGASIVRRARCGMARSFQHAELFPALTVQETLAIACDPLVTARGVADAILHTPARHRSEAAVRRRVAELVEQFSLGDQRELRISDLSTGQRRVVDLAAIVADRPSLVLLDEPSSGLAQAEVEALGVLLRQMHRDLGLALLVVEHDIPLIASLADRLVAMDQGSVIANGPPADVLADPAVIAAYLGTSDVARNRSARHGDARPAAI